MEWMKYCAAVVFSILMYFNSFAQNMEEGSNQNKGIPANSRGKIVIDPYTRTAPGCISTLSMEYYTGRALEIPSKACDFQKESIVKSQEEYNKSIDRKPTIKSEKKNSGVNQTKIKGKRL